MGRGFSPPCIEDTALSTASRSGHLSLLSSAGLEMSADELARAVLHSWEGNRRSSVALATHHRLCGISICGLIGQHSCKKYGTPYLYQAASHA